MSSARAGREEMKEEILARTKAAAACGCRPPEPSVPQPQHRKLRYSGCGPALCALGARAAVVVLLLERAIDFFDGEQCGRPDTHEPGRRSCERKRRNAHRVGRLRDHDHIAITHREVERLELPF